MIRPDWQYEHGITFSATQARSRGCLREGDRPSIVVTARFRTLAIGMTHASAASPFRCTVQAPHRPVAHPRLVPLRASSSRSTRSSDTSPLTFTIAGEPLTIRRNRATGPPSMERVGGLEAARAPDLRPHA